MPPEAVAAVVRQDKPGKESIHTGKITPIVDKRYKSLLFIDETPEIVDRDFLSRLSLFKTSSFFLLSLLLKSSIVLRVFKSKKI
jgi:hypothetical protein